MHASMIGSLFKGMVEAATMVVSGPVIVLSISRWARVTGINKFFLDGHDPFGHGFVAE